MPQNKDTEYLQSLLRELLKLPGETEWVEFKHNNADPAMIGEYLSALANSAALLGKQNAYVVWGIEDDSQTVVGTRFSPGRARHKKQELESWLLQKCKPRIDFHFYELAADNGLPVVILEIQAASHTPLQFDGIKYIRVGSYKKNCGSFQKRNGHSGAHLIKSLLNSRWQPKVWTQKKYCKAWIMELIFSSVACPCQRTSKKYCLPWTRII